jgi:IS5 family transposase
MVRRVTGELADLADIVVKDAQRLLSNAQQAVHRARAKATRVRACGEHDPAAGRRRGRLARAVNDLAMLLEATRQITAQTWQRLAGVTPDGATRWVSLHDPDARPIAKGRLASPWSSATRYANGWFWGWYIVQVLQDASTMKGA